MKILLNNIKMPINHTEKNILECASEKFSEYGICVKNIRLFRKSIDARRKNNIHYICAVLAETTLTKAEIEEKGIADIKIYEEPELKVDASDKKVKGKIVVVGTGPCGLFCAYFLAKAGYNPIIIERGADVDNRTKIVENFWKNNIFDKNTNVQFGEGGAGTFSDGKLTTRIGDLYQRTILEIFVKHGAPSDILYKAKPHIGTDILKRTIKNMRLEIEKMGGRIRFNTVLTDIKIVNNKICSAIVNDNEEISCEKIILAIGHSSRDTYNMLYKKGVYCEAKAFAAGVRIEHTQEFINKMQYGSDYNNPMLPAADYRLTYNGKERSCYSFCMCPGGVVVNASSEEKALVVNGMSEYARAAVNANSALVVTVKASDFESDCPLSGIEFQRKYEKLAYSINNGKAPVQLARDFIKDKMSAGFGEVLPSFTGQTEFSQMKECLPDFITNTLKEALLSFENKIKNYSSGDAVMTGVEMRTSAPVRILRNDNLESVSVKGLYPGGEGAGYAGGIMSAAVDGIKIAMKIIQI
ncbi:MAG: hypothetical protein E7415_00030 [Ruminococcaceae bacterium]|nr:hypothetical protein [Oscillospiraceae bacterium]